MNYLRRVTTHAALRGAHANFSGAACSPWLDHVMQLFALFMLCGQFATFFIQEMVRKTLEELSGEIYRHDGIVPNESKAVTEGDAAEEAKSGGKA